MQYSPLIRVRYKVENTRVGQDTLIYNSLLLLSTPMVQLLQKAFEEAAAILVNQYTALAGNY